MRHKLKLAAAFLAVGIGVSGLTACTSDADRASQNLSTEAEQFRVERRIVFYNGITDNYIAQVTGRCSVDDAAALDHTLEVTCKVGPNRFIKDYLGKSDNVTYFALQEKAVDVSVYHYEVIFKPENIVPDVRTETGKQ